MVRINGKLKRVEYADLTGAQVKHLLHEIMTEDLREEYEKRRDIDFAYEAEEYGRFRVNAFKDKNGDRGVFRTVPVEIPSPDDLGMPHSVRKLAMRHKGLVLITGATGSGKSTSLAALVNLINANRAAHIITIEDPIEFVHDSNKSLVSQREVGQHAESFSRALRSGLREDPDVILVGEMRDVETISLAVTAAETGHLVLGTLHTSSAAKTIDRVVDSFPAGQQAQIRVQLAEGLRAVIAQQLLPRKDGRGRVAAFEVLHCNSAVSNLIREGKTHQLQSVMQTHRKDGMVLMDKALMDLVKRKLVQPREAAGRAHDRKAFIADLRRAGIEI